ncbi:MAG: branched-chain amino acid transaminase [bacterium]|nr:branched-chain amino acid transaminase [bacterium]
MKPTEYIWMNGKLVKWEDAKIHVLSHVVHYGSSVFEGMRVYKTDRGPAAFRLRDHTQRLFNSAKIYRMKINFSMDEIDQAILDLIGANKLESCYVRPVVYRGYGTLGVDPTDCPVDIAIAVWPWGKYLGADALDNGVSVCFSSWNRMAPNTLPAMAKAGANYMNSQLIKLEALSHGYVEGIALDTSGNVSEGSGENIFMVRRGALITPTFAASILPGITRSSIIRMAQDMGIKVIERNVPREALYLADEVFFTGSAAEVTPISTIDNIQVGNGKCGPITKKLQQAYFDLVEGRAEDKYNWLTYVPEYKGVPVL